MSHLLLILGFVLNPMTGQAGFFVSKHVYTDAQQCDADAEQWSNDAREPGALVFSQCVELPGEGA